MHAAHLVILGLQLSVISIINSWISFLSLSCFSSLPFQSCKVVSFCHFYHVCQCRLLHWSSTRLKPLMAEEQIIDHVTTVQRSSLNARSWHSRMFLEVAVLWPTKPSKKVTKKLTKNWLLRNGLAYTVIKSTRPPMDRKSKPWRHHLAIHWSQGICHQHLGARHQWTHQPCV